MRVLVIPEDFVNDQHILKPIIKALMDSVGRPRAIVRVCQDPRLGGVNEALRLDRLRDIVERYQSDVDIFLLCIDRDGDEARRERLDRIERDAREFLRTGCFLYAEHAWQELEVWVLAGLDLPSNWRWTEIRAERDVKERYFEPLVRELSLSDGLAGGRKELGERAARRFNRIVRLCPEDVAALKERIAACLA